MLLRAQTVESGDVLSSTATAYYSARPQHFDTQRTISKFQSSCTDSNTASEEKVHFFNCLHILQHWTVSVLVTRESYAVQPIQITGE